MRIATKRSITIALTFVLSLLVNQAAVEAKCMGPQGNWSLSDGTTLPANATLFYFSPTWLGAEEAPKVMAGNVALKSTWQEASKNDAFTTYRLQFDAGDKKKVVIKLAADSRSYAIGAWQAPVEGHVTGTIGKREQSAWTCSHTDVLPAKVMSQAQAFQVSWFDLRNGYINFGLGSSIFPRSSRAFWSYGDKKESANADFELGHPNCFANNIPSDNLDHIRVTVTPLFRDGSKGKAVTLKRGGAVPEGSVKPEKEAPIVETTKEIESQAIEAAEQDVQPRGACRLRSVWLWKSQAKIGTRLFAVALLLGILFGFLVFRGHRQGLSTPRLVAAGSVVSILCGTLAWAASMVAFPFWLIFVAAGLFVLFLVARVLRLDE